MNLTAHAWVLLLSSFGIAGNATIITSDYAAEFSFTATNTTHNAIVEVLVSENKKDWGHFDIGGGIKSGATANLVWDQSTNSENCAQWVKASSADGSESKPGKFDFCKNDPEINF